MPVAGDERSLELRVDVGSATVPRAEWWDAPRTEPAVHRADARGFWHYRATTTAAIDVRGGGAGRGGG